MEMLHQIQLGIFKYTRDTFFELIGKKSKSASAFDGLCQAYGERITRQSDRDLPHCRFGDGIRVARLNAKELPGVILLMAVALHSVKGRQIVGQGKERF